MTLITKWLPVELQKIFKGKREFLSVRKYLYVR